MALLCKTALVCDFKSTSLKKKEIQITAAKWTTRSRKTSVLLSRVSLKLHLYFKGTSVVVYAFGKPYSLSYVDFGNFWF